MKPGPLSIATLAVVAAIAVFAGCAVPGARGQNAGPSASLREGATVSGHPAAQDREPIAATTDPWVCPTEPLQPRFEPTLYVAPDGSDENDGSHVDRPLGSLQRAAELAGPGDVVWLRGGVYDGGVVFETSGRPDAPVVFESHPGECAIIAGASGDAERAVTFRDVSHVVLRNVEVRDSPAEGIYLEGSSDNVLSNLRLHGNALSGIMNLDGDRNLFTYVVSHDNADARGEDADGISISTGDRNRIAYCVTYDNADDGVDTWRSARTLVERCISFRNGRREGNGQGFKAGGRGERTETLVRHSIAFRNRSNGFTFNTGRGVAFVQNTAFDNGGYGFVAGDGILINNLAVANDEGAMYHEVAPSVAAGNSWQIGLGEEVFVSTEPTAPEFLGLAAAGGAVDTGADPVGISTTSSRDLGALLANQGIEEAMRIGIAGFLSD